MMSLDQLNSGQKGVILGLHGGHGIVGRLATLGFTPGTSVEVVRNHGHGPLIVLVRGSQIALGRGEAAHVILTPLEVG